MRAAAKPPPSKPLPPTAVLLCLAGFAFPALRAVRVAPVVVLRQGEQTMVGKVRRWLGRSLLRRRGPGC